MKISTYIKNFVFLLGIVGILVSCAPTASERTTQIGINKKAPNFTLQYLNGKLARLSDYQGKIVILHFWASWCHSCVYELATLENLKNAVPRNKIEILAIAIDDKVQAVRNLQKKNSFSFPLLCDESGKVKAAYGVSSLPETFLIGPHGEYLQFPEPESGKFVTKTAGPQRWDDRSVIEYFSGL